MSLQQPPGAIPHLGSGKLRAHAVTSKRRISTAADVPTTVLRPPPWDVDASTHLIGAPHVLGELVDGMIAAAGVAAR